MAIIFAAGLGLGLFLGLKVGGLLAVRRIAEYEYRTMTRRAGLRK